jgi:hypothetical protein
MKTFRSVFLYPVNYTRHGLGTFQDSGCLHGVCPISLEMASLGAGVIWNGDPLEPPVIPAKALVIPANALVIPAKAGIHSATLRKCAPRDWIPPALAGRE